MGDHQKDEEEGFFYQRELSQELELTPVQQFYAGTTVFITGGSGFLGKQLLEKLFRSCDIKKVYLLLRKKRGKTAHERLEQLLSDQAYKQAMQARNLRVNPHHEILSTRSV